MSGSGNHSREAFSADKCEYAFHTTPFNFEALVTTLSIAHQVLYISKYSLKAKLEF